MPTPTQTGQQMFDTKAALAKALLVEIDAVPSSFDYARERITALQDLALAFRYLEGGPQPGN